MSILPIVKWPDARLSQPCAPVGQADVAALVADMFETMYDAPGRGLAAPQVGVSLRLFVVDNTWKEGTPTPLVMIDPELEPFGDMTSMDEMCLSVPDVAVPVQRPASTRATWTDLKGARHEAVFEGAEARVLQHEFDHLNGMLHFDRLEGAQRARLETPYLEALA